MVRAPMHFLNSSAPRSVRIDRDFQRRHVYEILRESGKYEEEEARAAANRIVEDCQTACER